MKKVADLFKITFIAQAIATLFLLMPFTDVYAKAGCCSKHGGVASCNTSTNHLKCKDGTDSPSCTCEGTTVPTTKHKIKPTNATTTTAPTTTTSTPTASEPATTAAAPTAATTTKPPKGCCAHHKGVAQCNKSTGFYMCKDGTASTTCKCS